MAILSVRDFSFTYSGSPTPALQNLTFELEPGTVTGVVGANGAGKSTLCYSLAGFIPHFFKGEQQGTVRISGADTRVTPLADLVTKVGLVFQNPFNQISGAKLTVAEEVAFGLETRVERALTLFGLEEAANQSPFTLSGGQQQRLALASIFVMEPAIMVLDEPTAQLDPVGTAHVMDIVAKLASEGRTLVLAEHKLEWVARLCKRVLALDRGALVADGPPREVLGRANQLGLNETRYARAAQLAVTHRIIPDGGALPQTLQQAGEFFDPDLVRGWIA
jgi:energy-coupling factor transporter ATP-binding protein EcfA2